MNIKNITNNTLKIVFPIMLGGAILYWMYRGFDFKSIENVLFREMDWMWMILSFPFGILAQMLRGWRWKQTLEPIGERPRRSTSINSIFVSYAASLVIPRIGEFTRCGILKRYDGVSFPKALGTVVTERAIDTLLMLAVTAITLLMQMKVFSTFFLRTGTSIDYIFKKFSATGYFVTAVCAVSVLCLVHILLKKLTVYDKVRSTFNGIWQGVLSLKGVSNVPLFAIYTLGICG